jgi:hypothetical protein
MAGTLEMHARSPPRCQAEGFPSRPKWMDPLWFGPEWAGAKEDREEGVEKDYEGESEIDALDEQDDVIAGLSAG